MLTFANNVKALREKKGLKQSEMIDAIGFPRTTWNNYEQGKSTPNLNDLIKIAQFFGVTETDLLHADITTTNLIDKKETQKNRQNTNLITNLNTNLNYHPPPKPVIKEPLTQYQTVEIPASIDEQMVKMPVLDMRFAAGVSAYSPDFLEAVDYVYIPRTWVRKGRVFACGRLRGDSMAPTLLDGGYGIIRMLEPSEWANMPEEEIYVIVSKENTYANLNVKRVKNRLSTSGFLVLMSDNPDKASYPNFNIYQQEIISIWHLDWYFTSRMPNIHNQYYSRLQALENKVDDLLNDLSPIMKAP